MKAITIREPYAAFIRAGIKSYETRSWKTSYRGKILIHAGKAEYENVPVEARLLYTLAGQPLLNHGKIVAIADLTDCILIDDKFIATLSNRERWSGFFSVGRYAWKLENIHPIQPIPASGKQGVWNFDGSQI